MAPPPQPPFVKLSQILDLKYIKYIFIKNCSLKFQLEEYRILLRTSENVKWKCIFVGPRRGGWKWGSSAPGGGSDSNPARPPTLQLRTQPRLLTQTIQVEFSQEKMHLAWIDQSLDTFFNQLTYFLKFNQLNNSSILNQQSVFK